MSCPPRRSFVVSDDRRRGQLATITNRGQSTYLSASAVQTNGATSGYDDECRCAQAPRRERVAATDRRAAEKRIESARVLRARGVVRAVADELATSHRSGVWCSTGIARFSCHRPAYWSQLTVGVMEPVTCLGNFRPMILGERPPLNRSGILCHRLR